MIFRTPPLTDPELKVLAEIEDLKGKLRSLLHEPRRWDGSIRRVAMARAILGSNTIEGYSAPLDDALAVELGEEPMDADQESALALKGYRDAMTYVLQIATDPDFSYSDRLLKSLHFMMTSHDLKSRPGLWRSGAIYVRNDETGEVVYEGAELDEVPSLISELIVELNRESKVPAMVRASMAHLNLVMVHPFRDGNGRMARCLQTLVLSREGTLYPIFSSVEEYLGGNTADYYGILAAVGRGKWQPDGDALPWVRFMLTAHLRQARTVLRRVKESQRLWGDLEKMIKDHGLPERTLYALYDAANGFRVRRSTYRAADPDEITIQMATRDLHQMVVEGLLVPQGEKRGRHYLAGKKLKAARQAIIVARDPRDDLDPFAGATQVALPL